MDNVIHKYLDNRITIEDAASDSINKILNKINLDAVIQNPQKELARVVQIAVKAVQEHSDVAIKEGLRFAKEVKAKDADGKDVHFDNSKDPNLNKSDLSRGESTR